MIWQNKICHTATIAKLDHWTARHIVCHARETAAMTVRSNFFTKTLVLLAQQFRTAQRLVPSGPRKNMFVA